MQAAPSTEQAAAPADLAALVWALRLLVAAFEAATTSKPALALLGALRGLLAIVAHHQADPEKRELWTAVVDDDGTPTAALTSADVAPPTTAPAPSSPPASSSSTTATSPPAVTGWTADAVGPWLHAFQRGLVSDMAETFGVWARIDQLAGGLALTVSMLDAHRPCLLYTSDAADE